MHVIIINEFGNKFSCGYYHDNSFVTIDVFSNIVEASRLINYLNGGRGFPFPKSNESSTINYLSGGDGNCQVNTD